MALGRALGVDLGNTLTLNSHKKRANEASIVPSRVPVSPTDIENSYCATLTWALLLRNRHHSENEELVVHDTLFSSTGSIQQVGGLGKRISLLIASSNFCRGAFFLPAGGERPDPPSYEVLELGDGSHWCRQKQLLDGVWLCGFNVNQNTGTADAGASPCSGSLLRSALSLSTPTLSQTEWSHAFWTQSNHAPWTAMFARNRIQSKRRFLDIPSGTPLLQERPYSRPAECPTCSCEKITRTTCLMNLLERFGWCHAFLKDVLHCWAKRLDSDSQSWGSFWPQSGNLTAISPSL
jgi:hypothetical protein